MASRIKNILPQIKEFFYTKTELDSLLSNKANASHNHSSVTMTVTFTDNTSKTYTIYGEES